MTGVVRPTGSAAAAGDARTSARMAAGTARAVAETAATARSRSRDAVSDLTVGSVVVGTAGHIDHGKTTLLRALTGIDADRLPEEHRRGMTIDVGYAYMTLPDGAGLDFVDVPGHDRLVGNMLVGAGEIDAALLVVAADDGARAQTLEHLELLDALGIADGVVAVTRLDLLDDADDPRAVLVPQEAEEMIARTTLAGAPIVCVSAVRGEGMGELREALEGLDRRVRARARFGMGPVRLGVDRSFVVRGRGLVVTGSLRGGSIAPGDVLRLDPGGRPVRVREVQVHGQPVPRAAGGGRVALNLVGIDPEQVRRGSVLSDGTSVVETARLLVALRPIRPSRSGEILRLHTGTDQVDAVVGRGRREAAGLADGRMTCLLRLSRPVAAARGDRFVLRRPSPAEAVAGGVVLEVSPPRGAARHRVDRPRLTALAEALEFGRDSLPALVDLHGALRRVPALPDRPDGAEPVLAPDVERACEQGVLGALDGSEAGAGTLDLATLRAAGAAEIRRRSSLPEREALHAAARAIDRLVASGRIVRDGNRAAAPGVAGNARSAEDEAGDRLLAALAVPAPPSLRAAVVASGCTPATLRRLEESGRLVRLEDDLAYAASAFAAIESVAVRLARQGPLTPAALRDATGTSRRYVVAIIEELDRRGVLARTPAGHVAGPRAGRA